MLVTLTPIGLADLTIKYCIAIARCFNPVSIWIHIIHDCDLAKQNAPNDVGWLYDVDGGLAGVPAGGFLAMSVSSSAMRTTNCAAWITFGATVDPNLQSDVRRVAVGMLPGCPAYGSTILLRIA
jgi:hypothetical protein